MTNNLVELYCGDVADFEKTGAEAASIAGSSPLLYFFAAGSCGGGDAWCGDCVRAEKYGLPVLHRRIASMSLATPAVLVHYLVPTRDEWRGNSTHPYRRYTPTGIPTLTWVNAPEGQKISLGEKECCVPELVESFCDKIEKSLSA